MSVRPGSVLFILAAAPVLAAAIPVLGLVGLLVAAVAFIALVGAAGFRATPSNRGLAR